MECKHTIISGLAVHLYLTYEKESTRPWGKLWPDEKEKWIKESQRIIMDLVKEGYLEGMD